MHSYFKCILLLLTGHNVSFSQLGFAKCNETRLILNEFVKHVTILKRIDKLLQCKSILVGLGCFCFDRIFNP